MENKIKVHEFDPQIYPRKLWIALTTENKIDDFDGISEMDKSCIAVVDHVHNNKTDKGGIMIRFSNTDKITNDIVTHEACHAAMEIIDYIGGKIDLNNQEYFCYLSGWIAKCCNEVLNETE